MKENLLASKQYATVDVANHVDYITRKEVYVVREKIYKRLK